MGVWGGDPRHADAETGTKFAARLAETGAGLFHDHVARDCSSWASSGTETPPVAVPAACVASTPSVRSRPAGVSGIAGIDAYRLRLGAAGDATTLQVGYGVIVLLDDGAAARARSEAEPCSVMRAFTKMIRPVRSPRCDGAPGTSWPRRFPRSPRRAPRPPSVRRRRACRRGGTRMAGPSLPR